MSSRIVAVRADDAEIAAWKVLAERLGVPFNRWARRALNEACELDEALLRERDAAVAEIVTTQLSQKHPV